MKKILTLVPILCILLFLPSSSFLMKHSFRSADWGMSITEVRESETLDFKELGDGALKILQYKYPSPEFDDAWVYYLFPEQQNHKLGGAGYIYYIKDQEARAALVRKLSVKYAGIYGVGQYSNDANFQRFYWNLPDKRLVIYNDFGAEAAAQFYYDYESIETINAGIH